jgi:DNA invertase Pin-like site-specific DNA recombinase
MDASHGLRCVIYAAKSTEDRKGSIPDQLRECRAALAGTSARTVVAEYTDEAFSAFTRDRGPGLRDAMQHAEDLAAEHGVAELWGQHSDRLARGDGKSARHAVEVALWALKHDVRVRTVQDPDTFRDLLYAVVTGQRNHEDSLRKGRSSALGRRRAAARGDYIGYLPDGYKLAISIDEHGTVNKRMVIDPDRQPAIELIFRLYLKGKRSAAIARAVNDGGWLTKPLRKSVAPHVWNTKRVLEVLRNPRYAGLATFGGEVVARGHWPAYITERQHTRIRSRLGERRPTKKPRQLETYLLKGLAVCGRCGGPLYVRTGQERRDGTFARRYACRNHTRDRHAGRCPAVAIDANTVEAMLVSSLRSLLAGSVGNPSHGDTRDPDVQAGSAVERQRLRDAVLADDEPQVDRALDALFARMQPEAALIRDGTLSQRQARELEQVGRFQAWIALEAAGRTEASRAEARELNLPLRNWFSTIAVTIDENTVAFAGRRRRTPGSQQPRAAEVSVNRAQWTRSRRSSASTAAATASGRTPKSSARSKPGSTPAGSTQPGRTGQTAAPITPAAERYSTTSAAGDAPTARQV